MFLSEQQEEERWKEADTYMRIYPILAAERYLPQSSHLPKLTKQQIENRISRHVGLET